MHEEIDGKAFYKLLKQQFASKYNDGIDIKKIPGISPEVLESDQQLYNWIRIGMMFTLGYDHGTQDTIVEISRDEPKALAFLKSKPMQELKNSMTGQNVTARRECYYAIKKYLEI